MTTAAARGTTSFAVVVQDFDKTSIEKNIPAAPEMNSHGLTGARDAKRQATEDTATTIREIYRRVLIT
jgi:hypothetical protein